MAFTAFSCMSGKTWEYRSRVMVMDECPSISGTIFGCTPFVRSSVAHVCLRSWNLVPWRSPAFLSRGFQERLVMLWVLREVPTLEENTHSSPPPFW